MGNATSPFIKYFFTLLCNTSTTDLDAEYIGNIFNRGKWDFSFHLIKKKC